MGSLRAREQQRSPRVLLVRLSAIGDCVHAVPMVDALRKQMPQAWIGWAIGEAGHHLLEGLPSVDRFHVLDRPNGLGATLRSWRRFARELRRCRYEVAIDVQGLTKSGLAAWLSRAPERIGFLGGDSRELNRWFINRPVEVPAAIAHVVDRNLKLLSTLGLAPSVASWTMPRYELDDALAGWRKRTVGTTDYAIVHPGTTWETKVWPPKNFGEVGARLVELGLRPIVTWAGERERGWAREIVSAAGAEAVLAPPTNLRELAALIAESRLFLGCDSGPLHLAAALGVPSVAVFGATDPRRNGPYGPGHAALAAEGLECWPCWKGHCARGDLACLATVSPAAVFERIRQLIGHQTASDGNGSLTAQQIRP